MVNVLYLSNSSYIGGAEKSIVDLIVSSQNFVNPIVVVSKKGAFTDYLENKKISYVVCHMDKVKSFNFFIPIKNMVKFYFQLKNKVDLKKIDVIHSNTIRSKFYGIFLKLLIQKKLIMHYRDLDKSFVDKFFYNFADEIICISKKVENFLVSSCLFFSYNKINKIYNIINVDKYSKVEYNNNIKIGCFGRFVPWKNYEDVIKTVNTMNNVTLYIAGEPNSDDEKKYYLKLNKMSNNNVIFVGFQKTEDFIKDKHIIVLSSINEPFGRTMVEAIKCGSVSISKKSNGALEVFENPHEYSYNSIEELKQLIEQIMYSKLNYLSVQKKQFNEISKMINSDLICNSYYLLLQK